MIEPAFSIPRTRFAPSPTGYLHIGGARTALFNYLLARRLGGKFLLRIEDTDQTRNIDAADRKLMDDLRWLGLQWDEGPEAPGLVPSYYQSARLDRYREHARKLLDAGQAYYAFDTNDELAAMRAAAVNSRKGFRYPRPATFPADADAERARAANRPVVVRLKMPDQDFVVHDEILGDVTFGAAELDDFVIVKSDGWPTYHFAVVVDDQDMGITHVVRGQEHLGNTPKHLALQRAFGYRTPCYAHLPLILTMEGTRMSKRRNNNEVRSAAKKAAAAGRFNDDLLREVSGVDAAALAAWQREDTNLPSEPLHRLAERLGVALEEIEVHDFRMNGYLPEVVVNFIALLGWSPGGDREKMTLGEMCERFGVERIGKTNARFDREKLLNFNTVGLAGASSARKVEALRDFLAVNPASPLRGIDDATAARLFEISPGLRVLREIEAKAASVFTPDEALNYDPKAVKDVFLKGDGAGIKTLRAVRDVLAGVADWTVGPLEQALRGFGEANNLGLGKVAQPVRVAVTGSMVSPPIFDTLALLGRDRTLARIDRALRAAAEGRLG